MSKIPYCITPRRAIPKPSSFYLIANTIDKLTMVEQHNCFLQLYRDQIPKKEKIKYNQEKNRLTLLYIRYTITAKGGENMRENLEEMVAVRCTKTDLEKMDQLRFKWEEEEPGTIYSRSDVLRICMRSTYNYQNQNSTLKKSLTNSS